MDWLERSSEAKNLLNPSFSSVLLWHAAQGYTENTDQEGLPFDVAFLVLPLVLHRGTRESLPKTSRTSLAVWLDINPLTRSFISERTRLLVPFTKEAMNFGGQHGLLNFFGAHMFGSQEWKQKIMHTVYGSSKEVGVCFMRANFVGKWFAKTGSALTIMTLFGVQP